MNTEINLLPSNPTYDEACDLIDNSVDTFWLTALEQIRQLHQLPDGEWIRIKEGANVLFKLNAQLIIKIVPPNWSYQGTAEIAASDLLKGKLSITIPEVIASGEINNWLYVVMTLLPGITLANIWDELSFQQKEPIVKQLGLFIRELHSIELKSKSPILVEWAEYISQLNIDCVARHKRKLVPKNLVEQIPEYLALTDLTFDDGHDIIIHMDLHPWNLMVDKVADEYKISGVLDFGDTIIGKSQLLELNTPILFLCQGNKKLTQTLIDSYSLLKEKDKLKLRQQFMVVALLRPACDFNFVLQQVPITGPRDNWRQIAEQLFPF